MYGVGIEDVYSAPTFSGGHFYPPADNLYDLGSINYSWKDLHVQSLIYATSVVGNWNPSVVSTYSLGTTALEWQGLYLGDDTGVYIGLNQDSVIYHRTATLNADTALAGVLIDGGGIDISPLAANSLIVSNITSNGDILIAVNDGGDSKQMIFLDGSTGVTHLGRPGTPATAIDTGDVFVGGRLEIAENVRCRAGITSISTIQIDADNAYMQYGDSQDFTMGWQTADANAHTMAFMIDADTNVVPVFVFGEETNLFGADLGLFDAFVEVRVVVLNNAGTAYSSLGSALTLWEQASAPNEADVAGLAQWWVKNDTPNNPYFTDDTGVDREIVTADYAGIFVDEGSSLTIDLVDNYHLIDTMDSDMPERISNGVHGSDHLVVGANGDYHIRFDMSATGGGTNKVYEFMVFEVATSGSAITSTTQATPCNVFASSHGFVTNNLVRITGVLTADELNDRVFTVTRTDENNFTLQDDEGVDINSSGFGVGSNGTATLVTKTAVNAHRKWAQADVGSLSSGCIATFTKDTILQLYVKNKTDAANITIDHCAFFMHRVG